MKIFEKINLTIIFLSLLLKKFSIPGSSLIFVLTSILLSVFYFVFTISLVNNLSIKKIIASSKEIGLLRIINLVFLGIGMSLFIIGVMFIIQYWNGGILYLLSGMVILFISGITEVTTRNKKDTNILFNDVIIRVSFFLILGLCFMFIAVNNI